MRDLLFNRDYRPLDRREYQDYRTYRQRNQTYYGRETPHRARPKYRHHWNGDAGAVLGEHVL